MDTDILVIGGGPAGMSAAQYALRAGYRTMLLEMMALGGQLLQIDEIENYPGIEKTSGFELTEKMETQTEEFGAEIVYGEATKIEKNGPFFSVETDQGNIEAKAVIVATGATHRHLGAPGEEEYIGKGVSYCATCDGPFFKGKDVIAVGGGDTALTEALYLSKIAKSVTLIHRRSEFRAQKALVDKINERENIALELSNGIKEVLGDGEKVTHVLLNDGKSLPVSGIFIFVGITPNSELVKNVADRDESGFIKVNDRKETSLKGLFAAGDVTDTHFRQVVTACSDGALSAHMADEYISSLSW